MNWYNKYKLSSKNISFPEKEIPDLQKRLDNNKSIGTTRILSEKGKYHEGDTVSSPLGSLTVKSVYTGDNIEDHPHYNELTNDWIKEIGNHPFDYIELVKSDNLSKTAAEISYPAEKPPFPLQSMESEKEMEERTKFREKKEKKSIPLIRKNKHVKK